MARNSKDASYDTSLVLKAAGLIAASAGSATILDMGLARFDARAIFDITACEVATGDEFYGLIVQGSNSATFASGVVNLGAAMVGDSSKTGESADTPATARREVAFSNEVDGVLYRYVRSYTFVSGTIATGINYSAFMVQEA